MHCPQDFVQFFKEKNRNGQGIISLELNEVSFLWNFCDKGKHERKTEIFLSLRLKELKQKQEIIEVRRKTMFNV